mgnify:CR=1 FL=1
MQQADPQKSEDDDIHRLQLVACEELTVQIIHRPQRPPRVYFRAIGNETEVPDQFEDGPFNRVIGEFDVDLETEGAIQTADKIVERMWHYVLTPDTQIHVERMIAGADEVGDGSIAKLSFAETYHRVSAYGAELSATVCTVAADASVDEAKQRLRECWLWSRAYTVSGGSSEMMRNILAKRRLALPSG